jgi:hypothetical protein
MKYEYVDHRKECKLRAVVSLLGLAVACDETPTTVANKCAEVLIADRCIGV